jgi:hypothetical protein
MKEERREERDLFRYARLARPSAELEARVIAAAEAAWGEAAPAPSPEGSPLVRLAGSLAMIAVLLIGGHGINDLALAQWQAADTSPPQEALEHLVDRVGLPIEPWMRAIELLARVSSPPPVSVQSVRADRELMESLLADPLYGAPHSAPRNPADPPGPAGTDRNDTPPRANLNTQEEFA